MNTNVFHEPELDNNPLGLSVHVEITAAMTTQSGAWGTET